MQPRRVRVADIERLKRTLENVPEHRAEEVTTAQAVRMLSSEIDAMQAKGYGLPAIAELLSDNGLAVTAMTLKTYLSEARATGGRKNAPQGQGAPTRRGPELRPTDPTTDRSPAVEGPGRLGSCAASGARVAAKAAPAVTTPPSAPARRRPRRGRRERPTE